MKRFSAILLILLLTAPFAIMSSYLKWEKKIIKREIKHKIIAGIDKNELVRLEFDYNELKNLRWEHSKEFEYKGEMYDIVKTEVSNDKIVYICWWDNEETKLNKKLNYLLNLAWREYSNDPNSPLKTVQLLFGEWLNLKETKLMQDSFERPFENPKTYYLQKKYPVELAMVLPPPKLICI